METMTACEATKWDAYYNTNLIGGNSPAYHITPDKHLKSILEKGLVIDIGDRSSMICELFPAVYLFPTLNDLEDALGGWLGECFGEYEPLHVFEVDVKGLKLYSETDWEYISLVNIEPSRLKYLREE